MALSPPPPAGGAAEAAAIVEEREKELRCTLSQTEEVEKKGPTKIGRLFPGCSSLP